MPPITYINRFSGAKEIEEVYGAMFIRNLYGSHWLSRLFSPLLHLIFTKNALFSKVLGFYQSRPFTKNQIQPFVEHYHVDAAEFEKKLDEFSSFNDFFTRKLKPECRPIMQNDRIVVAPADGRYWFCPNIAKSEGFLVKGKRFTLSSLLQNKALATKYENGAMAIIRLCPTDYHRFHFPIDCTPTPSRLINGYLYSVNPLAIKHNLNIFTENKRTICELNTQLFGKILYIEVGATGVGAIHQTYIPNQPVKKGDEKGFFSFGGSSIIMLFEPNRITFDQDLLAASSQYLEIKCLFGQSIGRQ